VKKYRVFPHAFLVLVLFSPEPLAQAPTGTVTGTVTDASGALVPGAEVGLTNEVNDDSRQTIAGDEGFFSLTAIPPGTYTLQVAFRGFATWKRTGIVLRVGDRIHLSDVVMKPASTADELVVTAATQSIIVDSGEKADIITGRQIQDLAIVGRSAVELLKIVPGAVYAKKDTPGEVVRFNRGPGDYAVSGNRTTAMAVVSDGADISDPGCNCGTAVTPNVDLVAEVKLQTANYAAENPRGPVVFQSVSKSGGGELHGEGYLYWRHHRFNSQDWRNNRFNIPKPNDSYTYPGFNLGGPLTPGRDRLFFFAGVEGMFQKVDLGAIPANVPTALMRRGDFSELADDYGWNGFNLYNIQNLPSDSYWANLRDPGFGGISGQGVIDPALIDPGGRVLINLYPLPNRDPTQSGGYNYVSNYISPQYRHQELVRLDWTVSESTRLYTRFNHEYQSNPQPYGLWIEPGTDWVPHPSPAKGDYHTWSSSTSLLQVANPSTTNEIVLALTYWGMGNHLENPERSSRAELGYPYHGVFEDPDIPLVPNLGLISISSRPSRPGATGGGVANWYQPGRVSTKEGQFANKWLVSLQDNFSKVIETHTLKFGGFWQFDTNDEPLHSHSQGLIMPATWGGNSTGNAYADLLLGRVADFYQATVGPVVNGRWQALSGYLQDSWKTTRRLTLEMGVRLEHLGRTYDKAGNLAGFEVEGYDPAAPADSFSGLVTAARGDAVSRSILKTPALLVSPRLGFAYDLFGAGTSVIRGGAGRFRYHGLSASYWRAAFNPPARLDAELERPTGYTLAEIDASAATLLPGYLNVLETDGNRIPETWSFSLTWSQRLPGELFWETSYVGNTSSHQLYSVENLNRIPEGAMFGFPLGDQASAYRPFGNYGPIYQTANSMSQNYHSLQVVLERPTGRLTFDFAYAFSKALGIAGAEYESPRTAFNLRARAYQPLSYDRTHLLSVAYGYRLPNLAENPLLAGVVNDWQITGISQLQSGAPIQYIPIAGSMADAVVLPNGTSTTLISAVNVNGTPDSLPTPVLTCDPSEGRARGQYVNPLCFGAPEPGRNGHWVMPYLRFPGYQNHDISAVKDFYLGSSGERRVQFRISAYNFLNHPLPSLSYDPNLTMTYEAGSPTRDSLERVGKAPLKRGRRLIQFALKFIF